MFVVCIHLFVGFLDKMRLMNVVMDDHWYTQTYIYMCTHAYKCIYDT